MVHQHPRVKYASLCALSNISTYLAPDIQENFSKNIVPGLCNMIKDNNENNRVRTHSIYTLNCFLKALCSNDPNQEEPEIETDDYSDLVKPYSKDILSSLFVSLDFALKLNIANMREKSLSGISLVATVLDTDFEPFYYDIIPQLKELLIRAIEKRNKDNMEYIAELISTISFVCSSCNKNPEKYMNDFNEFCTIFGNVLSIAKEEDPEVIAIFKAFSYLSTSMKTNFYTYLEVLFPLLSNYALADIGLKIEDVDLEKVSPDFKSNTPGLVFETKGGQNKKLSMKTFVLQNKVMALDVLKDICLNMNISYKPYIEKHLQIIKPFINVLYSRKIREISANTFEALIHACENELEQREVFKFIFPDFLAKFQEDVNNNFIKDIKYNLNVFIHTFSAVKATSVFEPKDITLFYELLKQTIELMENKKSHVSQLAKAEDAFDADDEVGFAEDLEVLNEINRRVMEVSGVLYKKYKSNLDELVVEKLYSHFLNIFAKCLKGNKNEQEMNYCACFFTDILSLSNDNIFNKLLPSIFELFTLTDNKSLDVLQNVIFGYGVIVQRVSIEEYPKYASIISDKITQCISIKVNEESGSAYDNGVAALGKVVMFKTENTNDGLTLALKFFERLPLKYDLEENKNIMTIICTEFLKGNPLVANNSVLPLIKNSLIESLEKDKDEEYLDDESKALINNVLLKLN